MMVSDGMVADDSNGGSWKPLEEAKALVETLNKVVACYHHLSSCVGSCTDSAQLHQELRQTQERAQQLAQDIRTLLTTQLRDRSLAPPMRQEAELLWVCFSSSLELFRADMCKVFVVGQKFLLSSMSSALIRTGIQGETATVTFRALGLTGPDSPEAPAGMDLQEQRHLAVEMAHMDHMMENMEQQVNVLRWVVEARGPQYAEPLGDDSTLGLLSAMQGEPEPQRCDCRLVLTAMLVGGLASAALLLSIGALYLG